jgi:glycosyltransferase involved in cell wall biosynthesis
MMVPKKMTVLQVLPALHSGGVERGTLEVVGALVAQGHTAIVASSGGRMERLLKHLGGIHIPLPLHTKNPFKMVRNAFNLRKVIQDYGVDIVHARSRAPAWSAYLATQVTRTTFITTYHGTYSMGSCFKHYYNSVMVRGVRVIAISAFIQETIARHYPKALPKVVLIPRGYDSTTFNHTAYSMERCLEKRMSWGTPLHMPVVLCPARLSGWKGQDLLLEAVSLMHTAVHVVFVGDKTSTSSQEKLAHYPHVSLHWGGYEEEMVLAYQAADIVVSAATKPEAFGRVVLEAQAMGKMVIAPNHGGALELITHHQNGFLYEAQDPKALADCLDMVVSLDAKTTKDIAMMAMKGAKARTTQHMTDATLKLYHEVYDEHYPSPQ